MLSAALSRISEKWEAFSRVWSQELKRNPRIQHFKMNDVLRTSRGPFRTFTAQQREEKVLGLAAVINQHVEWDCTSTLDYGAYRRIL